MLAATAFVLALAKLARDVTALIRAIYKCKACDQTSDLFFENEWFST